MAVIVLGLLVACIAAIELRSQCVSRRLRCGSAHARRLAEQQEDTAGVGSMRPETPPIRQRSIAMYPMEGALVLVSCAIVASAVAPALCGSLSWGVAGVVGAAMSGLH